MTEENKKKNVFVVFLLIIIALISIYSVSRIQ